jgi:hypothetical protein
MATGYLHGKFEQAGVSDYTPSPGNETTASTYSSKLIYFPIMNAKPTLAANPLERDDELRNYDQPIARISDSFDPTWDYESRLYPDLAGWHLAQVFGRVANYSVVQGGTTVSTTTTAASTTTTLPITSGTGTVNGQYVTGTGIPANTTIVTGAGSTSLTLSKAVSVASGASVSFGSAVDADGTTLLAAGQYSHTWTAPFGPTGAIPQTSRLLFAYKDQSVFYEARGCATEQLEIATPDQGGCTIKASGPATYLNTITDPTLTPSYESPSIRPFVHGNLSVTYADLSGAGYTTANAGTASEFTLQVRNSVNAIRTLGVSSQYPDRMEKDDGPLNLSGTLSKRNLTQADWDAMRNLSAFTLNAKWISTSYITGTTGAKYGLAVTIPTAQLVSGDQDALDNKRRHGSSFGWQAVYDGTTASATVKLVNATATYAT